MSAPRRQPSLGSQARDLASIVVGFVAGLVLPVLLYFLFVGIPWFAGGVGGLAPGVLHLPDPAGMIIWYVTLGVIGGILPDLTAVAYGGGLLLLLTAQARFLIVFPLVLLLCFAWIIVALITHENDGGRRADDSS